MNRINATQLHRLPGTSQANEAEVNGDFGGRAYPADERLELKVGAQVMFLRNDTAIGPDAQRWVNGTIGTITSLKREVKVEIDGDEHEVEPVTWEKFKYSWDPVRKKLEREIVAEFTQFPLRLAWAVTIHKSQGASYETAIVDLGSRVFEPGSDLRRAEPADRARRPLPLAAVAAERHHRRSQRRAIHVGGHPRDRARGHLTGQRATAGSIPTDTRLRGLGG